jgi:hypothetical protein
MKTILISLSLLLSSWAFTQKNNFYSSGNIDSLVNVLDQNKKNDMNKAYCLDQIVRYYINKEDYKSAGEYLLQYEELASQIGNPHALERSKYRRALWTYYASGREYLDTTAFTAAYEYFHEQQLDKFCLGISSSLCWYFDGFNGDEYGRDPNHDRHSSSTVKWYDIYAKHAIDFQEYDDAAAAYCNYSIRLRGNGKYKEAKKYLLKAEEADLKSETNKWSYNIRSAFIDLYFESEDSSLIEYYEQKIIQTSDEELLLKFYDHMSQAEFYFNIEDEMHLPEPGPWALKHDQLWAKLNPEQAKVKEEERLQREADRKERYSKQVSNGDNLLEEGKYEEAINAYCEARESTKERDEILEKLAFARSEAIKGLTEGIHEKESSSILKKRNEILDLLSISSDIPFSNNISQLSEVERQLDYSALLKDILQKTNSFEREYENQISEKSLKKAMSRLDELPPVEYYNISLVLLLEGYYGEAALLRGVGKARAQYSMHVSSGENQDEMAYRWMMMASGQNNRIFESHMVTADEAIKIQEQVISYLEKNDYTFAPKKANLDAYDLIVSEQKTSLLRIKSMREQLDQSYEHKKTQIMSSLKYLEREKSEMIPDTRTALNLEDLEGTWYRTENIEYWIDTNVRSSMYENDEEYWDGEDYDPSDNDYGLTVGDRVQLISENFQKAFSGSESIEEIVEEEYMEEEYIEEIVEEEYMEEEYIEEIVEEEYMEEEYMEEELILGEEGEGNRKKMNATDFEKYKGQKAIVIEINDGRREAVKVLFDDASIFYVRYEALGLKKNDQSEDESDENYEEEEYSEYYDYDDREILIYVDTLRYTFNNDFTASLNMLPANDGFGMHHYEMESIGYRSWKSINDLREAIKEAKSNMNYTYSVSNDGDVNYISVSTNSDMNDESNSIQDHENYGEGEFYDHSCLDHWMPSVKNGFYSINDRYTIYLENNSTLVIGKTYINNPTKFIPGSIIKLKRL